MYIDHSMLHAICHLGSSNLRLAVEPKRQIELLLLLRRYLLWLTMLMAFVHALCTRIGPPWQLQHTWIGVRSCAASTSFAMAARSCCTGATLLRFSIFPRTLTGCPSCQAFFRRCESQRVWPRIALVVRREGAGSSSRGSGPLPDGMCWWRPVYLRRWHGLELVPAAHAFQLRKCVRPRPTSRLTMWRRATSIDWWRCWQTSRSGATRVWLQPMIFGKCGGHGNEASGAGGSQHMSPWQGGRQRSATLWFWLGSIQAGLENLYSPCAACGFPTVLLCHICHRFVCFDCTRPCRAWPLLCWVPAWFCPQELRCRPWIGLGSGPQGSGGRGAPSSPPGRGLAVGGLEMQVQKWPAGSGTLGRGGQPGIGPRSRVGLGGRSAKLLALLYPGGISRCRYMSASRRPWARPRRASPRP